MKSTSPRVVLPMLPPCDKNSDAQRTAAKPAIQESRLLYRINVAEAKLGVSRSTIYRLVKDGKLELVKIGRRSSGITVSSVMAMIDAQRTTASTDTMAEKQHADRNSSPSKSGSYPGSQMAKSGSP